jgi:hypothetical protein
MTSLVIQRDRRALQRACLILLWRLGIFDDAFRCYFNVCGFCKIALVLEILVKFSSLIHCMCFKGEEALHQPREQAGTEMWIWPGMSSNELHRHQPFGSIHFVHHGISWLIMVYWICLNVFKMSYEHFISSMFRADSTHGLQARSVMSQATCSATEVGKLRFEVFE